jgi:hypothetical protein
MEVQLVLCEVRADTLNAARITFYDVCYQDVRVLVCPVGIYSMELVVKMWSSEKQQAEYGSLYRRDVVYWSG